MQVDRYKYLVWVPGNCASVRLALQLASDAAVLKVQQQSISTSLALEHYRCACNLPIIDNLLKVKIPFYR